MEIYFKNFFIEGNEIIFIAFLAIITAIIIFALFAVKKEIKK